MATGFYSPTEDITTATSKQTELKGIGCDKEAWVLERLHNLVSVCNGIRRNNANLTRANGMMLKEAIDGAINGQAKEIINTLGLEPSYINIKK